MLPAEPHLGGATVGVMSRRVQQLLANRRCTEDKNSPGNCRGATAKSTALVAPTSLSLEADSWVGHPLDKKPVTDGIMDKSEETHSKSATS